MSTGEHEIKEYSFVEEFTINEELANAFKVLTAILPALLIGVSIWLCLLGNISNSVHCDGCRMGKFKCGNEVTP